MKRKVSIRCTTHPKYTGIRIPNNDCLICWKIYAARLRIKMKEMEDAQRQTRS